MKWRRRLDDIPEVGGLASFTEFNVDPTDGTITLLSIQQKRLVQLLDLEALRAKRPLSDAERLILASNGRLRENPYDQEALAERAVIYERIGAWEAAAEQMTILESRAPDLAARHPHLSGTTAGRENEAQASPPLPWVLE